MNKSKRILSESLKDILSLLGIDSLTIKDVKSYILQMSWVDPGLKLYFMSSPYVMISSFQTLTQAKLFFYVPHWMVGSLLIICRPHHFLADPIRFCTPLTPSSCHVVATLQLVWDKRKWSKGGGLAGGFILSLVLSWVTQPKRDQRQCLLQTTSLWESHSNLLLCWDVNSTAVQQVCKVQRVLSHCDEQGLRTRAVKWMTIPSPKEDPCHGLTQLQVITCGSLSNGPQRRSCPNPGHFKYVTLYGNKHSEDMTMLRVLRWIDDPKFSW